LVGAEETNGRTETEDEPSWRREKRKLGNDVWKKNGTFWLGLLGRGFPVVRGFALLALESDRTPE
jgi:hypothetical protein